MTEQEYKYFVKSFLNFLKHQITERNFNSDVIESIEVATQCLEAAYDIPASSGEDHSEDATASSATTTNKHPLDDVDLFQLFQAAYLDVLPDRKEQAEVVKNEGNRLMKEGKFNEALVAYNKAISLDATNAAFYCNRAAAYLRMSDFEKSIADCKMALLYNPQYSKAYGRMGIAYANLRKFDMSIEAYKKALELEPDNLDYQHNLRNAEGRLENIEQAIIDNIPVNHPNLRNMIMEMMSDPMISLASQQVVSRVANQFPDVLNDVRNQLLNLADQAVRTSDPNLPSNQQPNHGGDGNNTGGAGAGTGTPPRGGT